MAEGALVINYGRSQWPVWWRDDLRILNKPTGVVNSANKIKGLKVMEAAGVETLDWTDSAAWVEGWQQEGHSVYARTTLLGKQGKGIIILEPDDAIVAAPLYTKAVPIMHEFRVHVGGGKAIDLVQKKRMGPKKQAARGIVVNELIRNHKRGWVFAHKDLDITKAERAFLNDLGVRAAAACGLDYAGVDVIMGTDRKAVVCEVNSAPGMSSPTTWGHYVDYFQSVINEI